MRLFEKIENPMVRPLKDSPVEAIGVCEGCEENIEHGEEYLDFDGVLLHEDSICIRDYVRNQSSLKIAGGN